MFLLYVDVSGSPITARQNAPIFTIIFFVIIVSLILGLIYFINLRLRAYHHSEKYLEKERKRKTKIKDIINFAKINNLKQTDIDILWDICKITDCSNILYYFHSNAEVRKLFKDTYIKAKEKNIFSDQKMSDFFKCLFKIEQIVAQIKKISTTRQIPEQSVVFIISPEGELYPLTVIKNVKDGITVEFPAFMYNSPDKPKILQQTKFNFKTYDKLSYNFVSRIIRYEVNPEKNTFYMIFGHTDQLTCLTQRNYKRSFTDQECIFMPAKQNPNHEKKGQPDYIFSDKKVKGKLTNFSAGGCCIQTNLPLKENQQIGVELPQSGVTETIVCNVIKTRKLTNGMFAIHVQFIHISIQTKNKIFTLVYKFEL